VWSPSRYPSNVSSFTTAAYLHLQEAGQQRSGLLLGEHLRRPRTDGARGPMTGKRVVPGPWLKQLKPVPSPWRATTAGQRSRVRIRPDKRCAAGDFGAVPSRGPTARHRRLASDWRGGERLIPEPEIRTYRYSLSNKERTSGRGPTDRSRKLAGRGRTYRSGKLAGRGRTCCGHQNQRPSSAAMDGIMNARTTNVSNTRPRPMVVPT
jgi:hypothetical protein